MSRFKQWSTVLFSRVDSMVSRMENHEALVDSAILEVRQSLGRAKVQLGRVQLDRRAIEARQAEARQAAQSWTERATAVAGQDEQRAMECLRRKHASKREADGLTARLAQQCQVEARLVSDIRAVEERLTGLLQQRNLLRTRESAAAARGAMDTATSPFGEDVGEVMERWEMQVTAAELGTGIGTGIGSGQGVEVDSFADDFIASEEQQALREELRQLTAGSKQ